MHSNVYGGNLKIFLKRKHETNADFLKPIAIIWRNAYDFGNNGAQMTDTLEQIQTRDEL